MGIAQSGVMSRSSLAEPIEETKAVLDKMLSCFNSVAEYNGNDHSPRLAHQATEQKVRNGKICRRGDVGGGLKVM